MDHSLSSVQDPDFQNSAWATGLPKNTANLRRVGKPLGKNVVERFLRLVYLQGTSPGIVVFYKNVKLLALSFIEISWQLAGNKLSA